MNAQVTPGFGCGCILVQITVVVLDLTGQEPQFSETILYLTARQSDPLAGGSQLKVSSVWSTLVNITFDGGGRGSAVNNNNRDNQIIIGNLQFITVQSLLNIIS